MNPSFNGFGAHLKVHIMKESSIFYLDFTVNILILTADRMLFYRHQYEPLAGPGHELEMSDITADQDMKKMVMDHRSRQIK